MRINQVIAIEKNVKTKTTAAVDAIRKAAVKSSLYEGFRKVYKALTIGDSPEEQAKAAALAKPTQQKLVQRIAWQDLQEIGKLWSGLFDLTAQKDFANCNARADVKINDVVIFTQVPATHLLFLAKQLDELHTIVNDFPTLDPAEKWTLDAVTGYHGTEPITTQSTTKEQIAIQLTPTTKEHPGTAQLITKDVVTGQWDEIHFSGALPAPVKNAIIERVLKLRRAVEVAVEEANMADAPAQALGTKLFSYVLGTEA